MAILIENMEMPKYCYKRPIHNPENGSYQLGVETYGLDVPKHCLLEKVEEVKVGEIYPPDRRMYVEVSE